MIFNNTAVTWEVSGSIGILSLNTPPENRILEPEFVPIKLLSEWITGSEIKGVIITGTGRHFSSGADLNNLREMVQEPEMLLSQLKKGNELLNYIQNIPLPVVAAISGACFGGGLEIALSCHVRICTDKSMFAFPESALGLIPGLGGSSRLLKYSSVEASMQLLLSGDIIDAERAKSIGIVDHIIDDKAVKNYCVEYIGKLVDKRSPEVIRSIMQSINNARSLSIDESLKRESMMFCDLAVKAFGKKDDPIADR